MTHRTGQHRRAPSSRVAAVVGVLVLMALVVGCAGDDASTADDRAHDAAVARTVCGIVLDWRNDLSAALNEAQRTVIDDAREPAPLLTEVFAEQVVATANLEARFDRADLDPDDPGESTLRSDLGDGVQLAVAALEDLRDEFDAVVSPDGERPQVRLARAFVGTEKPIELVKPEVHDDLGDEALEAAFAAEETCRSTTIR